MLAPSIPLSLYIHIPWCIRKCPYCDFNSHEKSGALPEKAYVDALLFDLETQKKAIEGRTIETLFIGGGTPSLFSPDSLEALLQGIRSRVSVADAAEITLEANPGTAESGRFSRYREIGLTRLSIGIQSFDPGLLTKIGRIHDGQEAIAAAEMAKAAGFSEFNLDLMFGLPGQTEALALNDIETAIGLNPTHLSFYQLTLEPNTVFHKYPPILPHEEDTWSIQELGQSRLRQAGFLQYEVSAYAQEGSRCRHNLNYWQFGDYLGIGAGAHGKITASETGVIVRTQRLKQPLSYMKAAQEEAPLGDASQVAPEEIPFEFLMNGLRLREGFEISHFKARTGFEMDTLEPTLSTLVNDRLIERTPTHIRCSEHGFNFLDSILEHFLSRPC
jgi:oxygen-independent coproporphyrinogen-3 oxidase